MKHHYLYFFSILFFIYMNNTTRAMDMTKLDCPISKADAGRLSKWDAAQVKRGETVAYKSGECFYYAIMHSQKRKNLYAIIVGLSVNAQGIKTTKGKLVDADSLRIIAKLQNH